MVTHTHTHTYIHTYTHDNYYNPRCAHAHRELIIAYHSEAQGIVKITELTLIAFNQNKTSIYMEESMIIKS